ncbi:MAG: hypothetical protein DRP27_10155 [Thermotogae bacterium]|nr:MAG: hypothetical protein DRP27_10155 [Thermotogota bacterium]
MEAEGVIVEEDAEIGGRMTTVKGLKARRIRIGRRSRVSGPLIGEHVRIERGAEVGDVYAKVLVMGRDSSAENLYIERGKINRGCRIYGSIKYLEDVKVDREAEVSEAPEKVHSLPQPPL